MSGSDYYCCDKCGRKTFYDAQVDWDAYQIRISEMIVLCNSCGRDYSLEIVKREVKNEINN